MHPKCLCKFLSRQRVQTSTHLCAHMHAYTCTCTHAHTALVLPSLGFSVFSAAGNGLGGAFIFTLNAVLLTDLALWLHLHTCLPKQHHPPAEPWNTGRILPAPRVPRKIPPAEIHLFPLRKRLIKMQTARKADSASNDFPTCKEKPEKPPNPSGREMGSHQGGGTVRLVLLPWHSQKQEQFGKEWERVGLEAF